MRRSRQVLTCCNETVCGKWSERPSEKFSDGLFCFAVRSGFYKMDALYRYGRARLFRFCLFSFGMFQVVDLGDGINQFAVAAAGFGKGVGR